MWSSVGGGVIGVHFTAVFVCLSSDEPIHEQINKIKELVISLW